MRIIGGRFRSRKLKSVPGLAVRPTPDRLREALFNVLAPDIEGVTFLDAYAGSGAVGLEALSRGARDVLLVERNNAALDVIRDNIETLHVEREVRVLKGSAAALARGLVADIAFLDPPYDHTDEYTRTLEALAGGTARLVIAQHPSRLKLEPRYGTLEHYRTLRQGDNSLSFYHRTPDTQPIPPEPETQSEP